MSSVETELLGFEIAFSLPDWFPPESAKYIHYKMYPKGHAYYGQVEETCYRNHAMDALHKLPHIDTTATEQICGNWVAFKFEDIDPDRIGDQVAECREALNELIKNWVKPIMGHEYLVQAADSGGYEVLDLSGTPPGEVVWNDWSYDKCREWTDQPVSDAGKEDTE